MSPRASTVLLSIRSGGRYGSASASGGATAAGGPIGTRPVSVSFTAALGAGRRRGAPSSRGLLTSGPTSSRPGRTSPCHPPRSWSAGSADATDAPYSAANAFLDAAAHARNRTSPFPWLTVNWDGWVRAEEEAAMAAAGKSVSGYVMTGAEGAEDLAKKNRLVLAVVLGHAGTPSGSGVLRRARQTCRAHARGLP